MLFGPEELAHRNAGLANHHLQFGLDLVKRIPVLENGTAAIRLKRVAIRPPKLWAAAMQASRSGAGASLFRLLG